MTHLLDVNALIALGVHTHEFHERVWNWLRSERGRGELRLATCSITELGFVRVIASVPHYKIKVADACALLKEIKSSLSPVTFLVDDQEISTLPNWVKAARQTTDGHLLQLATANDCVLATLDGDIPGAFLIP